MPAAATLSVRSAQGIALAAALVIGAPLPYLQFACFSLMLVFVAIHYTIDRRHSHIPIPWLSVILWAMAAWTGLQAIPIGEGLLARLGTPSWARVHETLSAAGLDSTWSTLSLEPSDSIAEAVKLVAGGFFLAAVASLGRNREHGRRLLAAIVLLGVVEFFVGLINVAFGPSNLFHLYASPLTSRPGFHVTLLNDNHAAGLFNLCTFAAIALAVKSSTPRQKRLWTMAAVTCAAGSLSTLSRAGTVTLLFCLSAYGLWWRLVPARQVTNTRMNRLAVLLLFLAVPAGLAAIEAAVSTWTGQSLMPDQWGAKVNIWRETLNLIGDHPWAGVGRGAFPSAFPPYDTALPDLSVYYVENGILQSLADWGIPAGSLFIGGVAATFLALFVASSQDVGNIAALVGLLAVAVQNLADFSLELPGLLLPWLVVLGKVVGRRWQSERTQRLAGPSIRLRWMRLAALGALLLCVPLAFGIRGSRALAIERMAQAVKTGKDAGSSADWRADVAAHPHASHVVYLAAHLARSEGAANEARRLSLQALSLAPLSRAAGLDVVGLDLADGRTAEAGRRIAALLSDHPDFRSDILDQAIRMGTPPRALARALVSRPDLFDTVLTRLRLAGRTKDEIALLQAGLADAPDDYDRLARLAHIQLTTGDIAAADRSATRLMARFPGRDQGPLIAGQIAFAQGRDLEAATLFREAYLASRTPIEAGVRTLLALRRLARWGEYDGLARELEPQVRADGFWETEFRVEVAVGEFKRGRTAEAFRLLDTADRLRNTPSAHLARARILESIGRTADAAAEYRRVLMLQPSHSGAIEALERLGSSPPADGQSSR